MHRSSRYDAWATRLFAKIERDPETGCWNWTASTRQGYGQIWTPSRPGPRRILQAHRAMYELANGAIPDGLDLDHLCRNTLCVNPEHLEPVTRRENVLRGTGPAALNARKMTCSRGHPLAPTGDGRRYCPTCRDDWLIRTRDLRLTQQREARARRRAQLAEVPRRDAREWGVAVGLLERFTGGAVPFRVLAAYAQHTNTSTTTSGAPRATPTASTRGADEYAWSAPEAS